MQLGAVAMIDALGFKGIWKREGVRQDTNVVLSKLKDLRAASLEGVQADDRRRKQYVSDLLGEPTIRFLSDTVFAAVPILSDGEPPAKALGRGVALSSLTARLSRVTERAAMSFPTLAYRGCVTVGDFTCEDVFILGEGVDEAASMMDEADGAFVWLSPKAKAAWQLFEAEHTSFLEDAYRLQSRRAASAQWKRHEASSGLVPYSVPLKSGGHFSTYVVSPFADADDGVRRAQIIERIRQSFDSSELLRVQVQKQNTLDFLEAANRYYGEHIQGPPPASGSR